MNDFWWGYIAGRLDGDRSFQRVLVGLILYVLLAPILCGLATVIVSSVFYGESPSTGFVIGGLSIGFVLQGLFWALQWRPAGRRRH